ncbi:hypothetical protein GCM10010275_71860 [Streptomyces litmocidini]|uniref:hypothetical protein n=1 Tax=Streptomyces litmocidini TaxID=67318 RepID=UPI00167D7B57|nr:hypothetical protein [Streptomyces litmocidini]GGV19825.1 hypothetical protein GCM10010275_71860 [Streptomyces litmocidini]
MSSTPPLRNDEIRGMTLRQPFAACVLAGKDIENRPRRWRPGWFLLHAGQSLDRSALRDPLVARAIRGRELVTGAVLGLVRVTGCHQDPEGAKPCTPWAFPGRLWHLELADVHELALPVPAAGRLGPWRPAADLVERVLDQLPHLRTTERSLT